MSTVEKVTISMPRSLMNQMQEECKQRGQKRSQFLQELVQKFFQEQEKQRRIEAYVAGYRKLPETEEELQVSSAILRLSQEAGLHDNETW